MSAVLQGSGARTIDHMMTYSVAGTPQVCVEYLRRFADLAHADELMVVHQTNSVATRIRSVELLAEAAGLDAPTAADDATATATATQD
ncbi:MAG: hypothetical protein M9952_10080 [Microthrixaceae bacterium]|nr:hypothetical protein [Microthrixaceae bacterium]